MHKTHEDFVARAQYSLMETIALWKQLCSQKNSPTGFWLLCWCSISVCKISSHADKTWLQTLFFLVCLYHFPFFGWERGCKVARFFSTSCLLVLDIFWRCFCPSCRNTFWSWKTFSSSLTHKVTEQSPTGIKAGQSILFILGHFLQTYWGLGFFLR